MRFLLISMLVFCLAYCSPAENTPLFVLRTTQDVGVNFINRVEDTDTFNILDYLYYYNGAGVAAADFDNDGMTDIYFVSNRESNKFYKNQGGWKFKDITHIVGLEGKGTWNTGVTVVDINHDGFQDIYLCNVGGYKKLVGSNQLYINQGDGTFIEESATYGLDITAFSTHATFFDYDKDGDLDMLLLCHSVHATANHGDTSLRKQFSPVSGAHLYRNEHGRFVDKSVEVGFTPSTLGYGLGVSVGDINRDGWEDVFISNDFHEDDYLYMNQGDGTFRDESQQRLAHHSNFSMGNAIYDVNRDGYLDLLSTDMLPSSINVLRSTESELSYDVYHSKIRYGYHTQYTRNTLQLNTQHARRFLDIALYAGVSSTDWTWGVLPNDFNHDGYVDLFYTNGIRRRMNDLDYLNYLSGAKRKYGTYPDQASFDDDVISKMPLGAVHNRLFWGKADMRFEEASVQCGLGNPSLSHGSVAVDLDNDGDLDLVTNNMNAKASLYENRIIHKSPNPSAGYLKVEFAQGGKNVDGIGVSLFVLRGDSTIQHLQYYTHTGFMSSYAGPIHIGLAKDSTADLLVVWSDNATQFLRGVSSNQTITLRWENALTNSTNSDSNLIDSLLTTYFIDREKTQPMMLQPYKVDLSWRHVENGYVDFRDNPLLPHMYSRKGPRIAIGDLNKDRKCDFYLGGASLQGKQAAIQKSSRHYVTTSSFVGDKFQQYAEIVGASIHDVDADGDNDIMVAKGGGEPSYVPISGVSYYRNVSSDRYEYVAVADSLMITAFAVADINQDGMVDIIASSWNDINNFGAGSSIHFWQNEGGVFRNVTSSWMKQQQFQGIIQDIQVGDMNQDGKVDIVVAGEWMPIYVMFADGNFFSRPKSIASSGLWQSISLVDINQDARQDVVAGNWGMNSKLHASQAFPLKLFFGDMDDNGDEDLILSLATDGKYYPFYSKVTLEKRLPYLKKEFLSFQAAAAKPVEVLFGGRLSQEKQLRCYELSSQLLLQNNNGYFSAINLPTPLQWSPIRASCSYTSGNTVGVWVGANFFGVSPLEGRYDAGVPGFISWDDVEGKPQFVPCPQMLLSTFSPITDIKIYQEDGQDILVVASNNGPLQFFYIKM